MRHDDLLIIDSSDATRLRGYASNPFQANGRKPIAPQLADAKIPG